MPPAPDRLGEHLAPEEPLIAVYAATLSENSTWKPVSIGVTDRRMLCVSEDGGFVNVGYDSIATIRSRRRTRRTYRGTDYRLVLGGGGLVAVLGGVGVIALATSALVPVLVLGTVGWLTAAAYLWRNGKHRLLTVGSGAAAVSCFTGIVLLASSALVSILALVPVGGLGLIDYARRHKDDFDGIELVRRQKKEVSIGTDDGRTIYVRTDPSEQIGRELSRLAHANDAEPTRIGPVRS